MNRKIKFRAWDKKEKYIADVYEIDFIYENVILLDYGAIDEFETHSRNFDEIELLQYTGLKDKNGKEIYEGDVVRCRVNDNSIKGEEAYILDKDGFGLEHIKKTVNYKIEFWSSNYNYGYRVKCGRTNFMITQGILLTIEAEIIGNIYENPELLEVNKNE